MKKQPFILLFLLLSFSSVQADTLKRLAGVPAAAKTAVQVSRKIAAARAAGAGLTPVTGGQVLKMTPQWKDMLGTHFSPAELMSVEKAILKTDRTFFDSSSLPAASYSEQFSLNLDYLLKMRGQELSSAQRKRLFGGSGVKGSTLANHFKFLDLQIWILTHGGEYPRVRFSENGKIVPRAAFSSQQEREYQLANSIKWTLNHAEGSADPVLQALQDLYKQGSRKKMPADWLGELKTWLEVHQEYPRSSFSVNGVKLTPAQYTPQQQAEAALANGVNNAISLAKDPSDPVIAELVSLKQELRRNQTPHQTLMQLQEWMQAHGGRIPRTNIMRGGKTLTAAEMMPEELEEKRLAAKARSLTQKGAERNDPAILQIKTIFQNASARKTSGQILAELQSWLDTHDGVLPRLSAPKGAALTEALQQEVALGRAVRNLLYYTPVHPNPQAQEVRRLWQTGLRRIQRRTPEEWLEAFSKYLETYKHYPSPDTPEYAGIRNLLYRSEKNANGEYVNPAVQQISEFNQLAKAAVRGDISWKEVTLNKETPLAKFWRKATPRQQAALQLTALEMDELREDFPQWLQIADEENWIIWDPQTADVMANLKRGINDWVDSRADEADNILIWLSDTRWGWDDELELFSRLRYTGKNIHSPKLADFYEVQEFTGMPQTQQTPSFAKIKMDYDSYPDGETRLGCITAQRGADVQTLQRALQAVLPQNAAFTLRMGNHELGITPLGLNKNFFRGNLHIHAEAQLPQEPVILSYTLDIDLGALVRGKSARDIKRLYAQIFRPYLNAGTLRILSK